MKIYIVMYNLFSNNESEVFRIFDSAWATEKDAKNYCDKNNNYGEYDPDIEYSHFYEEVELKESK